MNSKIYLVLTMSAVLLAGCGGDTDGRQVTLAETRAAFADQPPTIQLDQPIKIGDAKFASKTDLGTQNKSSAKIVEGTGWSIDATDREAVRLFYNKIYTQDQVSMDWSGDYRTGNAGAINPAYQNATLRRLNWYRVMAGLPAVTELSEVNSAKAQQAALMMSANGQLSHTPPATWQFYTQAGAEAAGSSNLTLGTNGPAAIDLYMSDPGDINYLVGHRRWIFLPGTRSFGTADVPAANIDGKRFSGSNALWIMDFDRSGSRPKVRDDFVAWPARGYAPYSTVYSRWSFSYPDADFHQASVSVSRDGVPVGVTLQKVEDGYAENTLAWRVSTIPIDSRHERPTGDTIYHVQVSGVKIGQQQRSFEYDVIVFDPAVPTAGAIKPQVTVQPLVRLGSTFTVQAASMANVTGYDLLFYRRQPRTQVNASEYNTVVWATGPRIATGTITGGALNLHEGGESAGQPQTVTLNKKLFVDQAGGAVSFVRSTGPAMPGQIFHFQISLDDGLSWTDAFTEPGQGQTTIPPSSLRVSLSAYAGRQIRIRFTEDYTGSAYIGAGTGWSIKDISFEGVDELVDEQEYTSVSGAFSLQATQSGSYVLLPRVQYQGLYFSDNGTPAFVLIDGLTFRGSRSAYTITKENDVITIRDNVGLDGVQAVRNPFRIDFADSSLAFDVAGNAGKAYRLYRAAFNRVPDATGLGFWISAADGGLTLEAMAREFVKSSEFASLYGHTPTNVEVITALYKNVLHRVPDESGANFWLGQIAGGMSTERLLLEFSESAENKSQTAGEVDLGIAFKRN